MARSALEPNLEALRDDIRRAGSTCRGLGRYVPAGFIALAGLLAALSVGDTLCNLSDFDPVGIPLLVGLLVLLGSAGVPAGAGTLAAYRRLFRRRLRDRLSYLSREEQQALLHQLADDGAADVRSEAMALLRELGLRTELTPSTAPTGRGDEVTASGDP